MVKKRSKILILVVLILMLSTIFSVFGVQTKKENVKADDLTLLTLKEDSGLTFAKLTNKLVPIEHTAYDSSTTVYLTYTNTFVEPPTNTFKNVGAISSFLTKSFQNDKNFISVYSSTGSLISGLKSPGTGAVIKLYSSSTNKTDENLIDQVTLVVLGDYNGDGTVSQTDVTSLGNKHGDYSSLSVAQLCAMDLNYDGYVNDIDENMLSEGVHNSNTYTVVYQIPPTGVILNSTINVITIFVLSIMLLLGLSINKKHIKKIKRAEG